MQSISLVVAGLLFRTFRVTKYLEKRLGYKQVSMLIKLFFYDASDCTIVYVLASKVQGFCTFDGFLCSLLLLTSGLH